MTDHLAVAVMKQAADLVARKQCLEASFNYAGLRVFGVGEQSCQSTVKRRADDGPHHDGPVEVVMAHIFRDQTKLIVGDVIDLIERI